MYLHSAFDLRSLRGNLPELPWHKRERYTKELGLKSDAVDFFVHESKLAAYFEAVTNGSSVELTQLTANYITGDLAGLLKKLNLATLEENLPHASHMLELMQLTQDGLLSSRGAKDMLTHMVEKNLTTSPKIYAEENGLIQKKLIITK